MTPKELRSTGSLAAVFAVRLLGLFMIYPVFATYAAELRGATPETIGFALGAYGLTQGVFQIPFGLVSDRIGRKTVITAGLLLFGAGSVVAALATSIDAMLIGRTLQGMGAVGSAVLAFVADSTREEVRTQAMAVVGMTIGVAFVIAIVLGPVLAQHVGLSGIFWLTAALALCSIAITQTMVPAPARIARHRDAEPIPALLGTVLRDRQLLRLDFGIFALHAILTASFLAMPLLLQRTLRLSTDDEWVVYLPVLGASVVLMVPTIVVAEKGGRMKEIFIATITLIGASLLALAVAGDIAPVLWVALVGFFGGFNIMEAMLPSLITKTARADAKGTASGIYSSAQFLGIFVGGAVGGLALGVAGTAGVFGLGLLVAAIWLGVAAGMRQPGRYSSYVARFSSVRSEEIGAIAARLRMVPGVVEAVIPPGEEVAYLKIDPARFNAADVARITGA
jgi:predicted MFS family arabinose efflux permease